MVRGVRAVFHLRPNISGNVFLVTLGDLCLFLVAFMEVEPVAERDAFSCGNREVAFGFDR